MAFPTSSKYVIVGAGIHGLSTAYHLALELKSKGAGDGSDILVVDKTSIAAGASGIACGVVRNNYFQPAMRELMAHSVKVWESDPEAYSYHPVGYMQISPEIMREDVSTIAAQQKDIGYESVFIEGADESAKYMRGLFDDWQAEGITSVLHEKPGGYSNNTRAMYGLAGKAEAEGVRILTGVTVQGFERGNGSGAITAVVTDRGVIECDYVVLGAGPWVKSLWEMLELPRAVSIKGSYGEMHHDIPMWIFWSLQEGTLGVDPKMQRTNDGEMPPVIHVDSDAPLISDVDGSVITEEMWGIYYKPDFHFNGIQGGAAPFKVPTEPDKVAVDPYGPDSPDFVVGAEFAHMWCSALAHCQKRFEGQTPKY
ncbi:MAG: FAD-dependent oxidoreductase, partial [Pseudomonadota bacterium]|nr:FAD-dependent oxidoreductase [Pseudomonadota bacterium]